jgi:hypothetical protein
MRSTGTQHGCDAACVCSLRSCDSLHFTAHLDDLGMRRTALAEGAHLYKQANMAVHDDS